MPSARRDRIRAEGIPRRAPARLILLALGLLGAGPHNKMP